MIRRSIVSADPVKNLQLALAIELAVLPPYLYACWSVKPPSAGASEAAAEASRTIRSVMYQEMLHVATVANILNALGEQPNISGQPMKYPGYLPGHVTTGPDAFTVGLCSLSPSAIDIFMKIERPDFDVPEPAPEDGWITIGAFYEKVKTQLAALPDGAFGHGRQLSSRDNPASGYLQPVSDLDSALLAIDAVIKQGEGHKPKDPTHPTPADEADDAREVAHYYKFRTIGTYFAKVPPATSPLIVPDRDVFAVIDEPDASIFSDTQKQLNLRFNQLYSQLLDTLQTAFSSATPKVFGFGTQLMVHLEHAAAMLRVAGFVPGTRSLAGPTFEYVGVRGGAQVAHPSLQGV
jgi:hypothetical protein